MNSVVCDAWVTFLWLASSAFRVRVSAVIFTSFWLHPLAAQYPCLSRGHRQPVNELVGKPHVRFSPCCPNWHLRGFCAVYGCTEGYTRLDVRPINDI